MTSLRLPLVVAFAIIGTPALAHTKVSSGSSFLSGLAHPLTGMDHLLAILAVGLWAGLLGRRALVALPFAFLASMLAGAAVGMAGLTLPLIEASIAASVFVLWTAVLFRARTTIVVASGICALFAFSHGFAHGIEMASGSSAVQFSAGFLVGTCLILLSGAMLSRAAQDRSLWLRD
jgi:urease accessory protein